MKTSTILVVLWLSFTTAQAQQIIEKHMNFAGKESLALNIQIADSISIQTWNKNEVYVKGSVDVNDNKDNDAYETTFDESGKTISVKSKFRENYFKGRKNNCTESSIYYVVFMPENTRFTLETIDANVTVTGKTSQMHVKSISGYIDLAVPANKPADIDFSTISGTMYSNLDLSMNGKHGGIPSKIKVKLNNGGDPIRLETISGDIYFRKSGI